MILLWLIRDCDDQSNKGLKTLRIPAGIYDGEHFKRRKQKRQRERNYRARKDASPSTLKRKLHILYKYVKLEMRLKMLDFTVSNNRQTYVPLWDHLYNPFSSGLIFEENNFANEKVLTLSYNLCLVDA